jgi:hypothetical protein
MKLMEAEQKIEFLKEQCFEKDEQVIINVNKNLVIARLL